MSSTEMGITVTDARIVSTAVETFSQLIEQYGRHAIAGEGGIVYEQPPVRISLHVMQMRSAGWLESFDQVATLSGASALFLYDRSSFMPKYAHTHIEPEARVADATGFGYEWLPFADAEEAWQIVRRSVNASRPVKGHHAEALLFAGCRDDDPATGRKVLTLLDGPETIRQWWDWSAFCAWAEDMVNRGGASLGRHTTHVAASAPADTLTRIVSDLVSWNREAPTAVQERWPEARVGIEAIEALANDVEDPSSGIDATAWAGCHALNPQWTLRRCTAQYLDRTADQSIVPKPHSKALRRAADAYRTAFEHWQHFAAILGSAGKGWQDTSLRRQGAELVRGWAQAENTALSELQPLVSG